MIYLTLSLGTFSHLLPALNFTFVNHLFCRFCRVAMAVSLLSLSKSNCRNGFPCDLYDIDEHL